MDAAYNKFSYIYEDIEINDSTRDFIKNNLCDTTSSWHNLLIHNKNISSYLVNNFDLDESDWNCLSSNKDLSEEFIEEFSDKVHWFEISQYCKLSENFIRKFQNQVDWSLISEWQILSEEFIDEFSDKVDWFYISNIQSISKSLISKYFDRIILYDLYHFNEKASEEVKEYIAMFI